MELAVLHRTSPGGLRGNMWYALFSLASFLFIYYILLILSRLSQHEQSLGCHPPFWGLILIGNRCRGHRGVREVGGEEEEEERSEGRDRGRKETDGEMTTQYIKLR